jgi:hypothetical protein
MKLPLILATLLSSAAFAQTQLLPDLVTSRAHLSDRQIDHTTIPGRTLLRLSNGVANRGRGRLELRGGEIEGDRQKVYQRIYLSNGRYISRFAGYNVFHPQHNHTHFEDFAHYKIREIIGTSGVGEILAESEKVSFCLIDESVYNSYLPGFSWYRRYRSCGTRVQGLSVGWKDVYDKSLYGQWIDITDLPAGSYWLESTADPLNRIRESSGSNNTTRIKISL